MTDTFIWIKMNIECYWLFYFMTKYTKHQYANSDYISEFIGLRFMVSQWNPGFDSLDELFCATRNKRTQDDIRSNHRYRGVAHLVALNTPGGKLVLVTSGTINLLLARDEALRANRILADHAAKALLVPLSGLVFHLLSA